ncbi:MAG: DUF4266 domain-containing protein [Deltaproteobacteria bacterium]|nr:DUF4266 domain-containing protein [Deltaproteobacteria bacterium]
MSPRHLLLLLAALTLAPGCVTLQPWERGILESRIMGDPVDPLAASFDGHVDGAREAVAGGEAVATDACGCN